MQATIKDSLVKVIWLVVALKLYSLCYINIKTKLFIVVNEMMLLLDLLCQLPNNVMDIDILILFLFLLA